MKYIFACVYSWAWHLFYGMWKGYCEMRYFATVKEYGWDVRGPVVVLCSVAGDYRIVKVFWKAPGPWQVNMPKPAQDSLCGDKNDA